MGIFKDQWFFIISNTLKGFLSKALELSVQLCLIWKPFSHSKFYNAKGFKRILKSKELPTCDKLFTEGSNFRGFKYFFPVDFGINCWLSIFLRQAPLQKHELNLFFHLGLSYFDNFIKKEIPAQMLSGEFLKYLSEYLF